MSHESVDKKVSSNLELTALLSSGITIVSSTCYIVLCIVALVYRYDCDRDEESAHSKAWWLLIYHVYFQNENCESSLAVANVTQPQTVFVLVLVTLALASLTFITSIFLIGGVKNQELLKNINGIVIVYVLSWVVSLAVDLAIAILFGMDYNYLTQELDKIPEYIMALDQLRHGALILMSIALKGYFALAVNALLICLLIMYLIKFNSVLLKEQHSIHRVRPLNAFEIPEHNWPQQEYAAPFNRGRTNNAFINDDDHLRSLPRSDFYPSSNQSFNRSESWQHHAPNQGSRLYPNTEEGNLSDKQSSWRRAPLIQGPPVPEPDYSPRSPKRLKSALKPAGYM